MIDDTAILEWEGEEYELKYSFDLVRLLRREGVNVPKLFREIMADSYAAADYGDEVASLVSFLLRRAGCSGVTDEDVWRKSLSDSETMANCMSLLMWVAGNHFAQSEKVPEEAQGKRPARRPVAKKVRRKTSR